MRRFTARVAALGLALLLTISPALASEAMGSELRSGDTPLSQGTKLTKKLFWSDTYSDLRTERFTSYQPNQNVVPTVSYGDKVLSRATLTNMARGLETQGRRVVSGINGDYYVLATGAPLGMVITDGVLRSSSSWHLAVGFREDGSAFIGTPGLLITAAFHDKLLTVTGGINKVRKVHNTSDNTGGLLLLTSDFSATTQNTAPGVDVILTPLTENIGLTEPGINGSTLTRSAELGVNRRVVCQVDQILESNGSIPIPKGKLVLTLNGQDHAETLEAVRSLQAGDTIKIDISSADARWSTATQAVGAMYKLVTNGVVEKPADQAARNAWSERTARTAIGIKADGTVIFYTMDGKQPGYSVGCTLTQVAMRLVELGCVEAVSLDGGGSTTIGATLPGQSSMEIQNKPADGSPRANSVAVFLTTELQPNGSLGSFYVTPEDSLLLAGGSVSVKATALDTNYYPMDFSGELSYFIYSGDGAVSTDGVFTAGSESGVTQVTVSSGNASGVATMSVVKTPDRISLTNEATGTAISSLSLSPGQQVNLKAASVYKGLDLISQDHCYTWTLDAGLGSVDSEGVITAGHASGSGKLTVSAGGRSVSIPVSIAGHINPLESFEKGLGSFASTETAFAAVETAMDYVHLGKQSLRLNYQAGETGESILTAEYTIPNGETLLSLWVYGDGSGNTLSATVADGDGTPSSVALTTLDFFGWKHIHSQIPDGTVSLQSIHVTYGGRDSGTLWLDQITTGNQVIEDTTPPTVHMTRSTLHITATVSDDIDKQFGAGQIVLTYDGVVVPSTWDAAANTLSADLPPYDGRLHRATVTASDASGNLGRTSLDVDAVDSTGIYTDMTDHWARSYATYLYNAGVVSSVEPDVLRFAPDRSITRGEFFAMTARWMGLKLEEFTQVELPFADAGSIPDWAEDEIKAMYSLGILKGSESSDGLRVNAGANISRAEAMTILGRTQARGYGSTRLTFADAGSVPNWALDYIRSLVFQGVVSGANNHINPNQSISRGEVAKLLYAMR
ncbi:MAG: hypothetical protein HFE97_05885 [Oscillospiraceae bacterium]|nr:hypothetical protein [Oscillospiraceae bacterium]